jgi:acetyl-CoA carboxylase biotin carboxyl carrier protein
LRREVSLDLEKLKEFINFMNENEICELEIEEEGKRIKLKKYSAESPIILPKENTTSSEPHVQAETQQEGLIEVKSPMVGTFYRAPSPGAKPFVDVGDLIEPGAVVCIIEAMKLMNEIKTELGGKIAEILAENGAPVEFGQPLFLVKPT